MLGEKMIRSVWSLGALKVTASEAMPKVSRIDRILIYRLGSLGDTVVALPCFHLIARRYPSAERRLLTNISVDSRAASPSAVIAGSDLVHSFMSYPRGLRDPGQLYQLMVTIRQWNPQLLIYLTEARDLFTLVRDATFFRLSGIKRMVGIPWRSRDRRQQRCLGNELYEFEAVRLARCIAEIGDAELHNPESWSLRLNDDLKKYAEETLSGWRGKECFIACCVGTKLELKDWGGAKWSNLLERLGADFRDVGLVLIGSEEESERSRQAAAGWRGSVLNLCGKLAPRETAAVLQRAMSFIGHDSGPMHLAASVGVPCTAVFSARCMPGVWFPWGEKHRVIYHRTNCAGCELERCISLHKACIESITVDEVYEAAAEQIAQASNDLLHNRQVEERERSQVSTTGKS
jgi:heptosyltransferase III